MTSDWGGVLVGDDQVTPGFPKACLNGFPGFCRLFLSKGAFTGSQFQAAGGAIFYDLVPSDTHSLGRGVYLNNKQIVTSLLISDAKLLTAQSNSQTVRMR